MFVALVVEAMVKGQWQSGYGGGIASILSAGMLVVVVVAEW